MVIDADDFGRTEKLLVDRDGLTFAEARAALEMRPLQISVGENWPELPGASSAVLTAVNCGIRAFRGGIITRLERDGLIQRGWGEGQLLSKTIESLGGTVLPRLEQEHLTIAIADPEDVVGRLVLWATWSGWSGGVVTEASQRLDEQSGTSLSAAVAGAIAVSECFQNSFHGPVAGRRDAGISLWCPGGDWQGPDAAGPAIEFLPESLWLAGLGHLGQAYAWILGCLEYPEAENALLLLQDVDKISGANLSTSLLANEGNIGRSKARVVAVEMEKRGFETRILERCFDDFTRRQETEPTVILSGFDNYEARRALGQAGFMRTIDAGLGGGHDRYMNILIRSFAGVFDSHAVFKDVDRSLTKPFLGPGYQREIGERVRSGGSEGDVRCGIIDVAGKAVGASFVGVVAASLVIAEVIRPLHGAATFDLVSADLGFLQGVSANESRIPAPTRLGFIRSGE